MASKLINHVEYDNIAKYYVKTAYRNETVNSLWWMRTLVDGHDLAAGAVYAKKPAGGANNKPILILGNKEYKTQSTGVRRSATVYEHIEVFPVAKKGWGSVLMGEMYSSDPSWGGTMGYDSDNEYYIAVIAERY